jgi:hypothetical protein
MEETMEATVEKCLRVRHVAEWLLVDQHRVLTWIRSGQLKAMNVSAGSGARARWRIPREALAEFEAALIAKAQPMKRAPRRPKNVWVPQYFAPV